ncbi:FkbM family methyltransferase [Spirosoma sp.]|uniref:FkbM family methyltransferase n=1 Tax=Spirosoma sp. TaxID=1899569 RepID=UPI003B3B262D
MKSQIVNALINVLDKLGLDGDRIAFKVAIFAYKLGLKNKIDNSKPFDFGDFKLYIDQHDTLQVAGHGRFEEAEFNALMSFLREDSVMVDIGANMGYYTVRAAQKLKRGKVIAFEPDPGNFAILQKNVAINQLSNVVLNNAALSNRTETMRLYKHPFNVGDYRLYNDGDFTEFVDVPTLQLDDAVSERIDLIKIDVQGFEYFALSGAYQLLTRFHPVVFSEFWPRGLHNSGASPTTYLNMMEELGYTVSLINEINQRIEPQSYEALRILSEEPTNRYVNLIFQRP